MAKIFLHALKKAYDRAPRDKLWKVLREYGVDGQLLGAIKSFYCRQEVYVLIRGGQSTIRSAKRNFRNLRNCVSCVAL